MNLTANTKYQTFMTEEAALMISSLLETPADFDAHFARYSYAVLTRSVFGFRVSDAKDPFVVHQENFIEETMKLFRPDEYPSNVFPFLRWLPSWTLPSLAKMERLRAGMDEEVHYLRRRVEKQIAEEKAGTARKASKWDSIYRHFLTNRDQYEVSDQEAGFTFQAMLGAGTRSPHNALLTFACLMMEYPEWQEKLQKEIDTVVGAERLPTFADVPNLPTVRAIVKEGIRYRSIKAELGIPHRLDEDDVYEGYFFPKGTVFFANSG
jgi:pseurotin biosynthesis cytochrome P450 monooxygenase